MKTTDILSKFLLFLSWSLVVIAVHFESDRLSDLTRKAPFLIEDLVHPQLSLIDRQHLKFTSRLFRSLDPFDFGVATSQFDGSASQRRRLLKTILALQQQKDIRQHRQLRKNLRVLINKPPFLAPFTGHGEDKIFEFLACR